MLLFRSKFILHIKSSSILNKGVLLSNKKEADWLFLTGSEGDKSAAIFTLIISNIYIFIYLFSQMNMDTTPLEAGLDYFIKFNKVSDKI